jgi:lipopolysaccharide export system permease protein
MRYLDSPWLAQPLPALPPGKKPVSFINTIPDSCRNIVIERCISSSNTLRTSTEQTALLYENERKNLLANLMMWHEKITMSIACLVLFLIGAPLGSIIRKGGIGLPLIFAVVFFVIFFLLNNFGRKFVKTDVLTPVAGMWLATYVLLPIGIFLTFKALNDSQLFNIESYLRLMRRLGLTRKNKPAPESLTTKE